MQSLKLYEQAIELDPDYAEPFTGIADSNSMLVQYGFAEIKEGYSKAREAAIEAITRNPNLPQAYVSLAWVQFANDWKLKASEKNYRKAIELDPKFAQAYHWLGLSTQGKFEEGPCDPAVCSKTRSKQSRYFYLTAHSPPPVGQIRHRRKKHPTWPNRCPQLLFNWSALYRTYHRQENKDKENLIQDVEQISNKDRNIYDYSFTTTGRRMRRNIKTTCPPPEPL